MSRAQPAQLHSWQYTWVCSAAKRRVLRAAWCLKPDPASRVQSIPLLDASSITPARAAPRRCTRAHLLNLVGLRRQRLVHVSHTVPYCSKATTSAEVTRQTCLGWRVASMMQTTPCAHLKSVG